MAKAEIAERVEQGMRLLACPEMFELSEQGDRASALKQVVREEFVEAIRQAESSCPERYCPIGLRVLEKLR